jgi:hypothetical protein
MGMTAETPRPSGSRFHIPVTWASAGGEGHGDQFKK